MKRLIAKEKQVLQLQTELDRVKAGASSHNLEAVRRVFKIVAARR